MWGNGLDVVKINIKDGRGLRMVVGGVFFFILVFRSYFGLVGWGER